MNYAIEFIYFSTKSVSSIMRIGIERRYISRAEFQFCLLERSLLEGLLISLAEILRRFRPYRFSSNILYTNFLSLLLIPRTCSTNETRQTDYT